MRTIEQITIGTRCSRLAVRQAESVAASLRLLFPQIPVTLKYIHTRGDKIVDRPLSAIGGKGLFTEEIEREILAGTIDLAVHSLKDVPAELPVDLTLGAITKREPAQDAFVSCHYASLANLPQGARVGTSSLRRKAQLLHVRPDLDVSDLRGNVDTRLRRLDAGEYAAIILAAAGLTRLQLADRITAYLPADEFIPAAGQGALALETRAADTAMLQLLEKLHDSETAACVTAERSFSRHIGGSCQIPAGAYGTIQQNRLILRAVIASPDGRQSLCRSLAGAPADAEELGRHMATQMLAEGGSAILALSAKGENL